MRDSLSSQLGDISLRPPSRSSSRSGSRVSPPSEPLLPLTARDLTAGIPSGSIIPPRRSPNRLEVGSIAMDALQDYAESVANSEQWSLAQTVLSRTNMQHVLSCRKAEISDADVYNVQVTIEGTPVANQLQSGRCWLFATTNVCRVAVARKFKLEDFQLSQSYLYFYDHLNKANWFCEQMLDLAREPLDDRVIQFLMAGTGAQDGGQYDLAANLIANYGLVPQLVYPESFNSSNSEQLDALLNAKLREMALLLRAEYKQQSGSGGHDATIQRCRPLKEKFMKEIYRILAIGCGTPPHPHEQFIWEFRDKDKKFHRIVTTPLRFVKECMDYDPLDAVAVINDPRHQFKSLYTVQRLGNVVGGRDVRYINMPVVYLKDLVVAALKDNLPVWFSCDVEQAANFADGVLDTALYNYNDAFGTVVGMNKTERLDTGDSQVTHAMMFTGVHLDEGGRPVRWRVENSWGDKVCKKGFLTMSDKWFSAYVYQVVVLRRYIDPELIHLYDHGTAAELPPWDPMGAAA